MNPQILIGAATFLAGPLMLSNHWLVRFVGMALALGVAYYLGIVP